MRYLPAILKALKQSESYARCVLDNRDLADEYKAALDHYGRKQHVEYVQPRKS